MELWGLIAHNVAQTEHGDIECAVSVTLADERRYRGMLHAVRPCAVWEEHKVVSLSRELHDAPCIIDDLVQDTGANRDAVVDGIEQILGDAYTVSPYRFFTRDSNGDVISEEEPDPNGLFLTVAISTTGHYTDTQYLYEHANVIASDDRFDEARIRSSTGWVKIIGRFATLEAARNRAYIEGYRQGFEASEAVYCALPQSLFLQR